MQLIRQNILLPLISSECIILIKLVLSSLHKQVKRKHAKYFIVILEGVTQNRKKVKYKKEDKIDITKQNLINKKDKAKFKCMGWKKC